MGTSQFAIPVLEALIKAEANGQLSYDILAVVTQPDKPIGRHQEIVPPPVKQVALTHRLPVLQPQKLTDPAFKETVEKYVPEVVIVAAYGRILPPWLLGLPPFGCLNVHGSLLPKWRGASPIAAAISAGEQMTGVTIMKMDEGMDTGPLVASRSLALAPDETSATLTPKLASLGADLLLEVLPRWLAGAITPTPQDDRLATTTRILRKEDGLINWTLPAVELERQIRAFYPWPGSFTFWRGKRLNILKAAGVGEGDNEPGKVVQIGRKIGVVTGAGVLLLDMVKAEGGREMKVDEFMRGHRDFVGSKLGS